MNPTDAPFLIGPLVLAVDEILLAMAPLAAMAAAGVFVLAAVTKLVSPARTGREFRELGIALPSLAARLVPIVELAVAAALLFRPLVGSLFATVTLLAFTAVVVAVLRSGRSVSCGCLGALDDGPISTRTVARNLALIALVLLAASAPDPAGAALALPAIEAVLVAGSVALLGVVIAQALALHHQLGRVWSVELAGEPRSSRSARSSSNPSPNPNRNRRLEAPAS